jgi:hypothetical protein
LLNAIKDLKDLQDLKDMKDLKDLKDMKDLKDRKDQKDNGAPLLHPSRHNDIGLHYASRHSSMLVV